VDSGVFLGYIVRLMFFLMLLIASVLVYSTVQCSELLFANKSVHPFVLESLQCCKAKSS